MTVVQKSKASYRGSVFSPEEHFIRLAHADVAEAVFGRLTGKTGGIYGPRSIVEDRWHVIASAVSHWNYEGENDKALKAVSQGLLMTIGISIATRKKQWLDAVKNLVEALEKSPNNWKPADDVTVALMALEARKSVRKKPTVQDVFSNPIAIEALV